MNTKPIDINKFIAKGDIRYYLTKPHEFEGYLVACNSYSILFSPLQEPTETAPEKIKATISRVLTAIQRATIEEAFVSAKSIDIDLPDLFGCKTCEGAGNNIVINTNEICQDCNGSGLTYYPHRGEAKLLGIKINPNYLKNIIEQPDLMLSTDEEFGLLFKTQTQFGCIMRMKH